MDRKKLIEYLPPCMMKYKEIKEIMSTEDIEMDLLHDNVQKCLNNAFIAKCDEYGIKKYESLLGINASSTETLESRKARVMLKWNDMIPYTYKVLVNRLNSLCGVNNYTIDADLENYYLSVDLKISLYSGVSSLQAVLEEMLPLNMQYKIFNDITCSINNSIYSAGVVSSTQIVNIGGM